MIERFENITKHINSQQASLESYLEKFRANINNEITKLDYELELNQYIDHILYDIDLLNEHLKEISESINLAKLGIISKHVLHPEEINYIYEILKKQNVKIVSDENIYELLNLQAYYNGSRLIFVIQIPNLIPENFTFYHLTQLPVSKNYTVNLEAPYILLNEKVYQFMDEPIVEKMRYCRKKIITNIESDKCVKNIINNKRAHCELLKDQAQDDIRLIEPNHLLVMSQNEIPMATTCSSNFHNKKIRGLLLINFDDCTITINHIEYSSKITEYWESVEMVPTLYSNISNSSIIEKISLQKLNNWTIENVKAIDSLKKQTQFSKKSNLFNYGTTKFNNYYCLFLIQILQEQTANG